ncbi:RasGEF [Gonapodya sp. JEL0774]|nr:RasGEF [Gonapodya sp. JEL0774]
MTNRSHKETGAGGIQENRLPLVEIPESRRGSEDVDVEPFPSISQSAAAVSSPNSVTLVPGQPRLSVSRPARAPLKAPTGPPPLPPGGRTRSRAPSAASGSPMVLPQHVITEDPTSSAYSVGSFSTISSEGDEVEPGDLCDVGAEHDGGREDHEPLHNDEEDLLVPRIAITIQQPSSAYPFSPLSDTTDCDQPGSSPRPSIVSTASSFASAIDNVKVLVRKRASTINQRGVSIASVCNPPKAKFKEPVLRIGSLYFSKIGRPILADGLVDLDLLSILDLNPVDGEVFSGYLTNFQEDGNTPSGTSSVEDDHVQIARFTLGHYDESSVAPVGIVDTSLVDSNISKVTEAAGGKLVVKSATLPGLILLLTSEGTQTDLDYVVDFLRTYRYFSDPADVARLLVTRYIECSEGIHGRALARAATASVSSFGTGNTVVASKETLLNIRADAGDPNASRLRHSTDSSNASFPGNGHHGRQASSGSTYEDFPAGSLRWRRPSLLYGGASSTSLPLSTLVLHSADGKRDDDWDAFIQLRVLNVFKKWLELHPEDFLRSATLAEIFLAFLELHVAKDQKRSSFAESLRKRYVQRVTEVASRYNLVAQPASDGGEQIQRSPLPLSLVTAPPRIQSLTLPPIQPMSPLSMSFSAASGETSTSAVSNLQSHNKSPSETSASVSPTTVFESPSQSDAIEKKIFSTNRNFLPLTFRSILGDPMEMKPGRSANGTVSGFPTSHSLADMDPEDLAKQLCLVEQHRFVQVRTEELFAQRWNEKDKEKRVAAAPNLTELIAWFNHIAYGFASEVCRTPKLKRRVSLLKRLIFCAHNCVKFNNYNSAFEIVAGLNLSSVTRMQKTWAALPKKYTDVWASLNKLISNEENHRVYRTCIRTLRDKLGPDAPCLPYLGVFLADLTFAEDGNPTYLTDSDRAAGVVNFAKFALVSRIIAQVEQFQKVSYDFKPDEKLQKWLKYDMVALDSTKLFEASKTSEPKQVS